MRNQNFRSIFAISIFISQINVFLGYYDDEPDEVDVPLSKRINRLNIENAATSTSTGRPSSVPLSPGTNGSNLTVNSHLETLSDAMNIDSDQISFQQHLSAYSNSSNYDSTLLGQPQPNRLSNDENGRGLSFSDEAISTNNIRDRDSAYSNGVISQSLMTFEENYSYPETSQYYKSNQLLNSLFLERQLRQNDSSL